MAATTHQAYTAAATTLLSTEFNSLTNGSATAASTAYDNSTNLDLYMDLELNVAAQGVARSTGATISVYLIGSIDGGSTYADTNTTVAELIAVFPLDAATTARIAFRRDVPVPPGLFKVVAVNNTGQTLAASATTLKGRFHSVKTV
jgi:hypothetical protein